MSKRDSKESGISIEQFVDAQKNYLERLLNQFHDHQKIESARIDVVLLSTSVAGIFFILKEQEIPIVNPWYSLVVHSLFLFATVVVLNLFFLIISKNGYGRQLDTLHRLISDLELEDLPNVTIDIILKKVNAEINKINVYKKPMGNLRAWFILNNLYVQFTLWTLAIVLLILSYFSNY